MQRHRQVDAKSSQLGDALLLPHGLNNRVQSHNSANRGLVTVGLTEPNIYIRFNVFLGLECPLFAQRQR